MRVRGPSVRRFSLVTKFGVLSAVVFVALGLVLGFSLKNLIRDRTLTNARQTAVLVARVGIQAHLTPTELRTHLRPSSTMMLDDAVRARDVFGKELESFTIWNRGLVPVYSSRGAENGHHHAAEPMSGHMGAMGDAAPAGGMKSEGPSAGMGGQPGTDARMVTPERRALLRALAGQTTTIMSASAHTDPGGKGKHEHLDVYVPIRFDESKPPLGVFKISMPYAPIAASIAHDVRWLALILATGLALLWIVLYRIVFRASRALRRQAEENEHLALHDSLTGLPNRTLFRDRVLQATLTARREGSQVALMLVDLDRFKEINDTLGHHNGDLFLKQVGPRLRTALRESDSVARLGGDEFGILLPGVAGSDDAVKVGDKIIAALEEPFLLQDLTLSVEASIGISVFPGHGADVDMLLQRADVAMYVAKESHTGCEVYAADRDQYTPRRLAMLTELRRAIEREELVLHYQPEVQVPTGRVTGVEALIRWQHPKHGLLYPDEFIPLAEHTGLIGPLATYVIDHALVQCRGWLDEGIRLAVSVNLSVRNLLDARLPEIVLELLNKRQVEPSLLRLELTENTIMADPKRAEAVLRRLREIGVGLAIDDFGTGYSSLNYLKRLPVDELKIDKSFVINMTADENDAVIVRSTIDLGRNLGLTVVAEGVESADHWQGLANLGCDIAQGYFFTRPVPPESLIEWLRAFDVAEEQQPQAPMRRPRPDNPPGAPKPSPAY